MTKREQIVQALVNIFKQIDGTDPYDFNLYENVEGRLRFWSEVNDPIWVGITAGQESRDYESGGFYWGYLEINIWIWVMTNSSREDLEKVFQNLELAINNNISLDLGDGAECTDVRIVTITDDQGLLEPRAGGQMTLQVQYQAS